MADVSVEFGAKDTGLENALKTVQEELTRLDEKVKGGELSFNELQSTMKKVAQAEKLQEQLQGMAQATDEAGNAAGAAAPKAKELGDTVQDAGNKADGAAGIFDSSFAKIAGAFTVGNIAAQAFEKIIQTAFDIARAAAQGFSDALDLGGRLDDLSKRTGETAGKLLVLENAFIEAGVSADQVGTTINKLQNFMVDAANGGEKQKTAMDNLGISLADLAGKTPTEQMGVFASKIAGIEDPSQRAAAASEVFGEKLGGKLLPLLTEFSPALDKSRESVGSLEEVMNENAATFAAAGDTIDRVKGKMAAFAAGIMSETLPALEDLGEGMESVDAAGLGREIGETLNPALQAFVDILRGAVDLTKSLGEAERNLQQDTGTLGAVYDAVYNSLAGFNQGMHDVMTTYTPFGMAMQALKERGEELRVSQDSATEGIKATGEAAVEAKPKLDALPGAGEKLKLEFQNLPQSIEAAQGSLLDFNSSLDDSAVSTNGIAEETVAVKDDFSEISSLVAQLPGKNDDFTQSISDTNVELELQPGIYDDIFKKISEAQAKEEERKLALEKSADELRKSIELQTNLKNAVANGNVKEQERVQKLIDAEAAQKRIKELTDQYIKGGLGKDEAETLAKNLVDAQKAAEGVSKNSAAIKDELNKAGGNAKTVSEAIKNIENSKMDQPAKNFGQRLDDAQSRLSRMKDFIGEDLGRMDLGSIIKKLGIDSAGLDSSNIKLAQVERAVQALEQADPADITPKVDTVGINDKINTVKDYLDGVKGVDATPLIDREKVGLGANDAKGEIERALGEFESKVKVKPEVDQPAFDDQISKMNADITNQFTGGEGGPGGEGGGGGEGGSGGDANADMTPLERMLDNIKELIDKIEKKLPMQALA